MLSEVQIAGCSPAKSWPKASGPASNGCTRSQRMAPVSRSAATRTGLSESFDPYARTSRRSGIGRYGRTSPGGGIRHLVAPVARSINSTRPPTHTVANGLCPMAA